jgi:glutamate dehydrogenase
LDYFRTKFDPSLQTRPLERVEGEILKELKGVKGLAEDRILRLLFWIVKGTVRTNYFLEKEAISFKFHLPTFWRFLGGIQPVWEGFVFHPDFYGLHLRMSKVSRGGLRWSNRYEDLREEIKSLMITQEAKNGIIVPEGAKGGFVILEKGVSKERFKEIYSLFIDALLDLIDTGEENPKIVKYDDRDFYFVVAADKGTAHMSDVANEIAIKRNYFLRDAFASGGSKGYNHKELGVTAKGAIRSAQRHFLEIGKNIYTDPIKVVGVGSMRGDVFGNGMLINPNFLLVGAISHREIFVDPNPDPAVAYQERLRLFREGLGWSHYDPSKISKGGGVFPRDAKSIPLSPEMKELLQTDRDQMSGEELVKALLTAPVELLYFGGIGTYIKSSDETNQEVGDKENEGVRVNGEEVRAFAICEGANLALTQKGRIEYAKRGGRLNMDAIDNSAGVNTSDYEVNLKILLNRLVDEGKLTEIEKDEILFSLTQWVMERVLSTNYHQSLIISLDQRGVKRGDFLKILNVLESNIKFFKRKQFAIPKNEEIDSILVEGQVVRPVLAILLLYSKILLKKRLLEGKFIDSELGAHFFNSYFPPTLQNFPHPLKREITATTIANYIINRTGVRFIKEFDPATIEKRVEAYLVLDRLIGAEEIRREIWSRDLKMEVEEQYQLLAQIEESLHFATKWLVKHYDRFENVAQIVKYRGEVAQFFQRAKLNRFDNPKLDTFFNWTEYYKFLPAAIYLKERTGLSLSQVMESFHRVLERFQIQKLLQTLRQLKSRDDSVQSLKRQAREIIEYFVIKVSEQLVEGVGDLEKYRAIAEEVKEVKGDLNSILHLTNRMALALLSEE